MITCEFNLMGLGVRIAVTDKSDDELSEERFSFEYDERNHLLFCRTYMYVERETKRHKFKMIELFGAWDKRQDNLSEMPKIPDKVREAAHTSFVENLNW